MAFDEDLIRRLNTFFPEQDAVALGGRRIPGVSTPTKAGAPFKWDERGGYGFDGASLVAVRGGLSAFDIEVALWTPEHFGEWAVFAKAVLGKPKAPYGLSISHPLVNMEPLNIFSVVVENVTQFEDDDGLYTCAISVKAYRAAKPFVVGPSQPTPRVPQATPPTAQDEAERVIAGQMAEINRLI